MKKKTDKCTYAHLNSRLLLTYLLACIANHYLLLLHTKVKTVSPNEMFALHAHIRRFYFTCLLTYYGMYWANYPLTFIALRCVIVYIAVVLTLSPFNTCVSFCEHGHNALMCLTYLFTYLLLRSKVKTSINCFLSHNFPHHHHKILY